MTGKGYSSNVTRLSKPPCMTGEYPIYGGKTVDGDAAWDLFCAAADGHVPTIKALLADDPQLVHAQHWYSIPLRHAVLDGRTEAVKLLLDAGSEPGILEAGLFDWDTLLNNAKRRGFDAVHRALLAEMKRRYGAEPNNKAFHALRDVIINSNTAEVTERLKQSPELVQVSDLRGNSALHWAVWSGDPELVDLVFDAGADPAAQNTAGETPLQVSAVGRSRKHFRDSDPGVRRLLERGVECDFHTACYLGDAELVRNLLAKDAKVACRLNAARVSPLTSAASGGNVDIVNMLLDAGADPNLMECRFSRGGALFCACSYGHFNVAKTLLQRGADPNGPCESSGTSADHAASEEILALLIEHGSHGRWEESSGEPNDLRQEIRSGTESPAENGFDSLLARVIWSNDSELLSLYLDKFGTNGLSQLFPGAGPGGWFIPCDGVPEKFLDELIVAGFQIDRPNWMGRTNLHFFASRNHCHNARLFVNRGADPNFISLESGTTALGSAAREGHEAMVQLLLELGADPSLPADRPKLQPRALAVQSGHDKVVAMLDSASS